MGERGAEDGLAWQPLYRAADLARDPDLQAALQAAGRGVRAWQSAAATDRLGDAEALRDEGFSSVRVDDPAVPRALAKGEIPPAATRLGSALTATLPVDALGAQALATLAQRLPQARATLSVFSQLDGLPPAPALALALAAGVELLRRCGGAAAQTAPLLLLPVPVGTAFTTEIAKLRAARATWRAVQAAFGATPAPGGLFARADRTGSTTIDPHANLIRGALAAFAAAAGGADQIEPLPFDPQAPAEARRLALNQLHLLRHEAGLARVHDPAAGAYAIEAHTKTLAQAAWELLQKVEAAGGYAEAPFDVLLGLAAARTATAAAVARGEKVIVGANRFADPRAPLGASADDTRPARTFEALRARAAALPVRPRAMLLPFGEGAARRAAAEFAADFLRLAGIEVDDHPGFADAAAMAATLAQARAPIAVLCGDVGDGSFVRTALPALRAAAPKTLLYATGHAPAGSERWGHVGFLHEDLDALGTLGGIVTRLGGG